MKSWHKIVLAAISVLVVILGVWLKFFYFSQRAPSPDGLSSFRLEGHQRLLVLAPHCDDETLGAAGLILAAQRTGIEVKVVIATNGDGYIFATMEDFHRIYPHASDFIRMGEVRQQESLAAIQMLGVSPDQVIFLGYPDRGTPEMWNDYWSASKPYHSPYSKAAQSPYQNTYNPQSVYAGEDYLADLRSILVSYQPDLIVYPHPNDVHPDHWGLSVFTRLAIAMAEHDTPAYHPDTYAYLVHRPDFPVPKGLAPQDYLLPPTLLNDIYPEWFRLDLPRPDTDLKGQAVAQYKTQLALLRNLLESFIRTNELFASPQPVTLTSIYSGYALTPDSWLDPSGQAIQPVQKDPAKDLFTRDVLPPADLLAVYAAQTLDGKLRICAQVRGDADSTYIYTLRLKGIGTSTLTERTASSRTRKPGQNKAVVLDKYACDSISLADLGNPWLILVAADVEDTLTGILDQAAWQLVYVQP